MVKPSAMSNTALPTTSVSISTACNISALSLYEHPNLQTYKTPKASNAQRREQCNAGWTRQKFVKVQNCRYPRLKHDNNRRKTQINWANKQLLISLYFATENSADWKDSFKASEKQFPVKANSVQSTEQTVKISGIAIQFERNARSQSSKGSDNR